MAADKVAVVGPYYFFEPPIGVPQRTRFLNRWREHVAAVTHRSKAEPALRRQSMSTRIP